MEIKLYPGCYYRLDQLGPLFDGWTDRSYLDTDFHWQDWFDNGRYLGPDGSGVEPVFVLWKYPPMEVKACPLTKCTSTEAKDRS